MSVNHRKSFFNVVQACLTTVGLTSAFIETLALTATGFILGYSFLPNTPLFAVPGFSWLIIGPLFSGLRYGFFYAFLSTVLITSIVLIERNSHSPWANTESIATISLILLWIGFIGSGFKTYWEKRINKLKGQVDYLDTQLKEVTKTHSLTKISHDRLQELVVSQVSLRNGILEVRRQIMNTEADLETSGIKSVSAIILRLLSDYGDIQMANLYEVDNNHKVIPTVIGSIGNHKGTINIADPLITEAMETRRTVSLKHQSISANEYKGGLILVIPIADSMGKVWGIVAVHQMPFRSYRPENLKLISTLAGYIEDLLSKKAMSSNIQYKDIQLHDFIIQVQRCILDVTNYSIPSVILGFEFKNEQTFDAINALLLESKRGLDQSWSATNRFNHPILCLLLPLTSDLELEAYKLRIIKLLQTRHSFADFQTAGVSFYQKKLLPNQSSFAVLNILISKLHLDKNVVFNIKKTQFVDVKKEKQRITN